jgi:V/A-type H+-transporting ATPase subunit G/H
MEDIETLKKIKEKETSINNEIASIKQEREIELQQLEQSFNASLKAQEENLYSQSAKEIAEVKRRAQAKASGIIEQSRLKAEKMKLNLTDRDIEEYVKSSVREFLEE